MTENLEQQKVWKEENLGRVKHRIVVLSGKGGVGKSTVAVNLAYALLMKGYKVGIMDVDIHGPSLAKMVGIEGRPLGTDQKSGRLLPVEVLTNLYALSTASLLESPDQAIIWRGPMKMKLIQQFMTDISWPELDYLVVDCPPGTGDEPLSVLQELAPVDGAVVVSTPQEVSYLDVRKSIDFLNQLQVPILGFVENMGAMVCPHCGHSVELFPSGGAARLEEEFGVELLARVPFDVDLGTSGDQGKAYVFNYAKKPGAEAFMKAASRVAEIIAEQDSARKPISQGVIAVPALPDGTLSSHFGHAPLFRFYTVQEGKVVATKEATPPPHDHGALASWLKEQGVCLVLAGGMGAGAKESLEESGILPFIGVPELPTEKVVESYLAGTLKNTPTLCDHSHQGEGGCSCHSHGDEGGGCSCHNH